MTTRQLRELFSKAFRHWSNDHAARHAAALAFYAMLSLAPLIVFGIALGSQFLDSGALRASLLQQARSQLGEGASDLVREMIENATKPSASAAAGLISLLLAMLGASSLFGQLEQSVNSIWGVTPRQGSFFRNFIVGKLLSVAMVLAFVALILGWLGIDAVLGFLRGRTRPDLQIWPSISFGVSVAFLTGVFGVSFKSLPRGMVAWKDVWIGAFVTALGFSISKYALSIYFGMSGVGAAYGPAGALVVILLWFYYSAQIFFFGVELTFAYTYGYGSHRDETEGELQRS